MSNVLPRFFGPQCISCNHNVLQNIQHNLYTLQFGLQASTLSYNYGNLLERKSKILDTFSSSGLPLRTVTRTVAFKQISRCRPLNTRWGFFCFFCFLHFCCFCRKDRQFLLFASIRARRTAAVNRIRVLLVISYFSVVPCGRLSLFFSLIYT